MVEYRQQFDIRIFMLLVEVVEFGSFVEFLLLVFLDEYQVEVDLIFFNMLVRKKSKLGDLEGVKVLLLVLVKRGFVFNLQIFCNLVIGCYRLKDGLQFFIDMKKFQVIFNIYIYSVFINVVIRKLNYIYFISILKDMKQNRVLVNEVVICQLEFVVQYFFIFDWY